MPGKYVFCIGGNEEESILTMIAGAMAEISDNIYLPARGNPLVIITLGYARMLDGDGYNKQAVKEWLFEHRKVSFDRFPEDTSMISYEDGVARDVGVLKAVS